MKFVERVKIVETLPYESRLAYVAYCAERCFAEAKRHVRGAKQFSELPLLQRGLDLIWARAEKREIPGLAGVQEIMAGLDGFEVAAPDRESTLYIFDPVLAHGARMLKKGLQLLITPAETARFVAGAEAGPNLAVGVVYTDWEKAQAAELTVTEAALQRLAALGAVPVSRSVFEGIPDWPRGEVSKKYAANQVKGTAPDDDE